MPFTLSHAVIAIPTKIVSNGRVPFASIFIGSLSPDFPYLFALTTTYAPGHSASGVLIYCLFPSLVLLLIWYKFLEKASLQFMGLPTRNWSFTISTCTYSFLGIVFGAYSHVIWDATSHSYGILVINSDFWKSNLGPLPLYKWNQYISGLFGLFALSLWYAFARYNNRNQKYEGNLSSGITILLLNIIFFVFLANYIHSSVTLSEYAVRTAIGLMVGSFVGACLYATLLHLQILKKKPFERSNN